MSKNVFILIIFNFFIYLTPLNAEVTLSCSHPEICRLAQIIMAENQIPNYQFKSLVKIVGDPHEFEPTAFEIKNLIMANILLSGPHELNPWIKKVNYQRSKLTTQKSINVTFKKADYDLYPNSSHDALSHFWLYPKLFCSLKNSLEKELHANGLLKAPLNKKIECLSLQKDIETELKKTLESINLPIVLTHDALLPLFETLSMKKNTIVAIKGSAHHQETTPQSVKKLYDILNSPKVIWIEEKSINVPQNILSKKRASDISITIDSANSESLDYFQILKNINAKLLALKK